MTGCNVVSLLLWEHCVLGILCLYFMFILFVKQWNTFKLWQHIVTLKSFNCHLWLTGQWLHTFHTHLTLFVIIHTHVVAGVGHLSVLYVCVTVCVCVLWNRPLNRRLRGPPAAICNREKMRISPRENSG